MAYTNKNEQEIFNWLKDNLNEERYIHSLSTAKCAKQLAQKCGLDEEKAYIAGLLHDCAKCFPKNELLSIIENNLDVEETEKENPKTLHAPVSAFIAKENFGVNDSEILSAIRWHTIGKIEMSLFEKIIFLADKIEPDTRDEVYTKKITDLIYNENSFELGLNKGLLMCYKMTIISLVERDLKICPMTIDIYNYLQKMLQQN